MPPEESPQDKYARIQRQIQEQILSGYPNPERNGCPGSETLDRLARFSISGGSHNDNSSDWHHVTHCSECYCEYLAVRANVYDAKGRKLNVIRWSIAGTVLLVAFAVFVLVRIQGFSEQERPQNAELGYQPKTLKIDSMSRSASGSSSGKNVEILSRGLVDLTIQLPIGSKAGLYEFRMRGNGNSPVIMRTADADIRDGITSFALKLDLRSKSPGSYSIDIRQDFSSWNSYPVELR